MRSALTRRDYYYLFFKEVVHFAALRRLIPKIRVSVSWEGAHVWRGYLLRRGPERAPCTLVWDIKEKNNKKNKTLAALLHYSSTSLSCTCQRGWQATNPEEVGLGFSQLVVQMAADSSQRKQVGWRWGRAWAWGASGRGKEDIVEIFFVKASDWNLSSQNTFCTTTFRSGNGETRDLIWTGKGI